MIADDSGIKPFDPKFVASNLQNLLRCPKCSKCFTYLYNTNSEEDNHRPFLLGCGHTLCESCLWNDRLDPKCAVCHSPAPPTIVAKRSDCKSVANLRDLYELNYHVLGISPILSPTSEQVTVFYIDFHDTEKVSFNHLKVMPSQLFMFPLRSFCVKLHGIKRNKSFKEKSVRQALQACLCQHPLVFARVHYPLNYYPNRPNCDADLIEVELYENRHEKKLVYQSLCENWMFLKKS
uniref:IP07780p n=1 Tax=Drosophila melanogaster TaxID=7227 RepID=C4XVG5_DROME|nr:IP07780p [Drosophila melanogaster]